MFSVCKLIEYFVCYYNRSQCKWSILIKIFKTIYIFSFLYGTFVAMIVWELDIQHPVHSVPITINVVSLNPVHGELYLIQHYVIKFVSDLRQVDGFFRYSCFFHSNSEIFVYMEDVHILTCLRFFFLLYIDCLIIFNYMFIPYNIPCLCLSIRFVLASLYGFQD